MNSNRPSKRNTSSSGRNETRRPRGGSRPSNRFGAAGEDAPRKTFRSRDNNDGFEQRRPRFNSGEERRPRRPHTNEGFNKSYEKPYVKKSTDRSGDKDTERKSFIRKDENYGKPYRKTYGQKTSYRNFDNAEGSSDRHKTPHTDKFSRGFDRTKDVTKRGLGQPGEKTSAFEKKPIRRTQSRTYMPPVEKTKSDDGLIRLNKFLSNSGVGSRRQADEYISMGLVTVNGETVTTLGYKIKPTDEVRYENKRLKMEKNVYVLLNKPKNLITTTDDPQERETVMTLVANAFKERIYPVGRLDRNTTGLLLLTNDGELAEKLTHPSHEVKKIYKVDLDKPLTNADFDKIADGIYLEEGKAIIDDLAIVSEDRKTVGVEIHIGWNRIVRRIFERMGYEVLKLDRAMYAGLDKKNLGRGEWRTLTQEEISRLKRIK